MHPNALLLRAQRSEMLAANIANADTPGYKARDINFQEVLAQQTASHNQAGAMRKSDPRHLDGVAPQVFNTEQYRVPLMPSLDGNTVDVQLEQTEFAENSVQFQASLRFVNSRIKGMMTAIKGE